MVITCACIARARTTYLYKTMSTDLRRWFKSDSTASSSKERALEAAKMSVEKLEMEEIVLQRTGRKRKSVERHNFD